LSTVLVVTLLLTLLGVHVVSLAFVVLWLAHVVYVRFCVIDVFPELHDPLEPSPLFLQGVVD